MLMKNSKFFKAVGFVVIVLILSAAFTGCETESHDVSGQYAGIEAKAPANQVDILLFNDFHGNVAEDTRPGKGKNAGMAKMIGYVLTPLWLQEAITIKEQPYPILPTELPFRL